MTAATKFTAEATTFTLGGAAVEGEVPTADDFIENAVFLATLKTTHAGSTKAFNYAKNAVLPKLQEIYVRTGKRPGQVVQEAANDPVMMQDLFAEKIRIKKAYQEVRENPTAGTPADEMVRLMKTFVVQRGAAIVDKNGNTIVQGRELKRATGTERNFGFTKAIFKHGLSPDEMALLPVFLREYAPYEVQGERSRYRIGLNEQENYVIAFHKSGKDNLLITMFRENITPEMKQKGMAYSQKKSGEPEQVAFAAKPEQYTSGDYYFNPDGQRSFNNIAKTAENVKQPFEPDRSFGFAMQMSDTVLPQGKARAAEAVKVSDTVKMLQEKLNIPVRVGKLGHVGKGVMGWYKARPEIIRTRTADDIRVIAHEIGHHLEKVLFGDVHSKQILPYLKELSKIATRPGGKAVPETIAAEGFAEFLARYITAPELARRDAPKFFTEFEQRLEKSAPIRDVLRQAQEDVRLWREQPAAMRVLSKISVGEPDAEGGFKTRMRSLAAKLYTDYVDSLKPFEIVQKELSDINAPPDRNAYLMARLYRAGNALNRADQFIRNAPRDWNGHRIKGVKAYGEILKGVENLDEFRAYLISKRALELNARGIQSGIMRQDAEATVKAFGEKYSKAARELYAFQDAALKYAVDSGLMKEDVYRKIKENNRFYIPFQRVIDDMRSSVFNSSGQNFKTRNPVKRIKGSGRDIIDPLESIIKQTTNLFMLSEKNRVLQTLSELSRTEGSAKFIERIPTPKERIRISADELNRNLDDVISEMFGGEVFNRDFDIYRNSTFVDSKNQIAVYRNGKREIYQVAPELAEVVNGLTPADVGPFVKLLSLPAGTLRAGAVLNPDFLLKNITRDTFNATFGSKNGFIPILDSLLGIKSILTKDDYYKIWREAGGGKGSTLMSMNREKLQIALSDLRKTGYTERVWNALKNPREFPAVFMQAARDFFSHPLAPLESASDLFEQATRLGDFRRAIKKGKSPIEAEFESREVTLDFARRGAKMRGLNMMIPFLNAGIQGTDKFFRTLKDGSAGGRIALASLTMASVFMAIGNYDDEDVRDVKQVQKDMYWVFSAGEGADKKIYRIPKPQQYGFIVGTFPERMTAFVLDKIKAQNSDAFYGIWNSLSNEFQLSVTPTAIRPFLESYTNKNFFTGKDLIPAYAERLVPEYQYTRYTSETMKFISRKLAEFRGDGKSFSPIVADNFVRNWTGGLGSLLLDSLDRALQAGGVVPVNEYKEIKRLSDNPFVRVYMLRNSSMGENVERFYAAWGDVSPYLATYQKALRDGDIETVMRFVKYQPFKVIEGYKETVSDLTAAINEITALKDVSVDEKRQQIDQLSYLMSQTAARGLEIYLELKEQMEREK